MNGQSFSMGTNWFPCGILDGLILLTIKQYLHHRYCKANLDWIFGAFWFGILFKLYNQLVEGRVGHFLSLALVLGQEHGSHPGTAFDRVAQSNADWTFTFGPWCWSSSKSHLIIATLLRYCVKLSGPVCARIQVLAVSYRGWKILVDERNAHQQILTFWKKRSLLTSEKRLPLMWTVTRRCRSMDVLKLCSSTN